MEKDISSIGNAIKENDNEILSFVVMLIDSENIIPSEVSLRKTNTV